MAGFEDVIQRALEKQGTSSVAARELVYNSARNTLAKMLGNSGNLDPENIRDQQRRLEIAIAEIETKHLASETAYMHVNSEFMAQPTMQEPAIFIEPDQQQGRSAFKRRPFALLLLSTIVLVMIGMGSWWVYDQELIKPATLRDNSVPNPPKILAAESSLPESGELIQNNWLTVFEPGDPRGLSTQAASSAELASDEDGDYVRLSGRGSGQASNVILTVEPGIMETIHGRTATIELRTRSGDGEKLQFFVTCQFNSSGDCGRKRFTTGAIVESFVFNVDISKGTAEDENKSGSISILADISGQGRSLDLYSFRITAN